MAFAVEVEGCGQMKWSKISWNETDNEDMQVYSSCEKDFLWTYKCAD